MFFQEFSTVNSQIDEKDEEIKEQSARILDLENAQKGHVEEKSALQREKDLLYVENSELKDENENLNDKLETTLQVKKIRSFQDNNNSEILECQFAN